MLRKQLQHLLDKWRDEALVLRQQSVWADGCDETGDARAQVLETCVQQLEEVLTNRWNSTLQGGTE